MTWERRPDPLTREQQIDLLDEMIHDMEEEIAGLDAQIVQNPVDVDRLKELRTNMTQSLEREKGRLEMLRSATHEGGSQPH